MDGVVALRVSTRVGVNILPFILPGTVQYSILLQLSPDISAYTSYDDDDDDIAVAAVVVSWLTTATYKSVVVCSLEGHRGQAQPVGHQVCMMYRIRPGNERPGQGTYRGKGTRLSANT